VDGELLAVERVARRRLAHRRSAGIVVENRWYSRPESIEEAVMKRRDFVRNAAGTGAALSVFPAGLAGLERSTGPGGLERRALGKTGEKLSVIGFGGIVVMNATTQQAAERVKAAVDAGVNYFDVAPSYGNAEDMLGPALEPHRKGVFLACKT